MKDLVQIIQENPGCVAVINNDSWLLASREPDWDKGEEWGDVEIASSSDEIVNRGDGGYGPGSCYGGDILQALAEIVGIKIESV